MSCFTRGVFTYLRHLSPVVDLGGIEPPSEQLILGHAKILVVNSVMISHRIRLSHITASLSRFLPLSWVANPLKDLKRSERLFKALVWHSDLLLTQGSE